jgi:acyl-CoA synthetase (AMP-forming)/AMP-acid ligase II/pimeloyl-ACP methyl ester carboxylesterase
MPSVLAKSANCVWTTEGKRRGQAEDLYEMFAVQAQRDPDAVAILAPRRTSLSFGALLDQIDSIRDILTSCGLRRTDRIAHLGARGPDTAVAMLGIASSAVCLPLNPAATSAELEQSLLQTAAKALLVPAMASSEQKEIASRLGITLLEYSSTEIDPAGRFRIKASRRVVLAQGGRIRGDDVAFVLRTSGTTAQPKIVPITHDNLIARADKTCRMLGLSAADCCLNLMPLCYNHGLNSGLIAALAAGCAVVCPPTFDADTFFACMRDFSPTWYTGSFTYHSAILGWLELRPNVLAGHRLRFVRTASGPLQDRVRAALEDMLGVPVLEYYGATETGMIVTNFPGGRRKPGMVGVSPDNDVAIMDTDGKLLPAGDEGEVVVRGPTVFGGYENDLVANQRVLRGGWYRTGDQGFMDADGYLKLIGRLDEVINRGGAKIAPREIDEALLAHEAVTEAVSFPVPHPTLYQNIAAAVVPRSGAQLNPNELRSFLARRLALSKIPDVIIFVAELPKSPTGKLVRSDLPAHFRLDLERTPNSQAEPPTKTLQILRALWREVLKRQDVGCDDDFFQLGGDSLSATHLIRRIEEELHYKLPLTILTEAPTVNQLEPRLGRAALEASENTICISAAGRQPPLFAVSGRLGHLIPWLPILRSLGSDQPCYGLQPPGMDWTNSVCKTVPEMAEDYIGAVKAVQQHGPYRLLGTSFGGLVVFEMALQLQRMGESVEFLGMVDTTPPTCLWEGGADVDHPRLVEDPHRMDPITLRVAENNVRARANYVLDCRLEQNLFRGELTYFYCAGNPIVAGHDRRRLWQRFASRLRLLHLPGIHGAIDREPNYTALRELLTGCLKGKPLTKSDPVTVFDRSYRIDARDQRIVSSMGDVYHIAQDDIQGCVEVVKAHSETIQFTGWAIEPCNREPAKAIAVFLDDRFIGYGATGVWRPDVAQHASTAQHSGFDFYFRRVAVAGAMDRPRLFVLSSEGRAFQLRISPTEEEKIERLVAELANSQAECVKLKTQLEAMNNSTCWRITKPLRQIRHIAATYKPGR